MCRLNRSRNIDTRVLLSSQHDRQTTVQGEVDPELHTIGIAVGKHE
jgi:hypothetical protein